MNKKCKHVNEGNERNERNERNEESLVVWNAS